MNSKLSPKELKKQTFCDNNCNECPIILHKNSRLLTKIFNELYRKLGDEVYNVVQKQCPNLTVCYDCRVDDFVHVEKCELIESDTLRRHE